MKYIKYFKSSEQDGYEEIDPEEIEDLVDESSTPIWFINHVDFTTTQKEVLYKLGLKDDSYIANDRGGWKRMINLMCYQYPKKGYPTIWIHKTPDEWYYVSIADKQKVYKCDQFDSVLKCLKNECKVQISEMDIW
jgi:hypothetical protein